MTLRLFLPVIVVLFYASSLFAGTETFPFLAEVKSNKVNIRAGQSPNFEALDLLKRGDTVIVVAKEYSWYKVRLPYSAKSFVSDKYVKLIDSQEGEIVGNRVNVRAAANVNNTAVAQLNAGSKVKILEKLKDWYRIEPVEESFGWISQEFLEFKSNDFSSENVIAAEENALKAAPQETKQDLKKEKILKEDVLASSEKEEKSSSKDVKKWVKAKVASIKKDPAPLEAAKPVPAAVDQEVKMAIKPSQEKKVETKKSKLPKKSKEEKKLKSLKKSVKEEKIISLMGILKPALPPISPSAQFVLEVQGKPPYGVQGDKKELEKYLYSVVTVEGVLRNKQFDNAASIIEIKKIEVVAKKP